MNQQDQKVRNQWKTMVVTMTLFTLAHQLIVNLYDPSFQVQDFLYTLLINSFNVIGIIGLNYWFYHCAYKKGGTKFLTLFLIVSPVAMIGTTMLYILKIFPFPSHIPFYWLITLMSYVLATWMFILNWKLRKVNQRMQLTA